MNFSPFEDCWTMSLHGNVLPLASSKVACRSELEGQKLKMSNCSLIILSFPFLILNYITFPFVFLLKRPYLFSLRLHGNNSMNASDSPFFPCLCLPPSNKFKCWNEMSRDACNNKDMTHHRFIQQVAFLVFPLFLS